MMFPKSLLLGALVAGVSYVPGSAACKCAQPVLCDVLSDDANILFRGKVLTREEGDSVNDDVTYEVELVMLFNGSPILPAIYPQTLTFLTSGSSAACGVYLELERDYLVHVYFNEYEGMYRSTSCGVTREWSALTKTEIRTLRAKERCDDDAY